MLGLEELPLEPKKPQMDSKEIMKKRRERAICIVSVSVVLGVPVNVSNILSLPLNFILPTIEEFL